MSVTGSQVSDLKRITTGVDRLDQFLNGGIPRNSVVFVTGLPDTGKTMLSEQCAFAYAAFFEAAVPDPAKYRNYLWAINDYFKRQGVTIIMKTEVAEAFAPLMISVRGVSFPADNTIFLRFNEAAGEIKRAIGVLKMRGSWHDPRLRELILDPPHMRVGPLLTKAGMLGETTREVTEVEPAPAPERQRLGERW